MPKKKCSNCFNLIKVPARIKILKELKKFPQSATKILSRSSLTQPTVSYHLRILEKNGMLFSKRRGRNIFYYLNEKYPCKGCPIFQIPLKCA